MNKAIWTKKGRKKVQTGRWRYAGSDRFIIHLDSVDPVIGISRSFDVYGDSPEFNGWKLKRDKQ